MFANSGKYVFALLKNIVLMSLPIINTDLKNASYYPTSVFTWSVVVMLMSCFSSDWNLEFRDLHCFTVVSMVSLLVLMEGFWEYGFYSFLWDLILVNFWVATFEVGITGSSSSDWLLWLKIYGWTQEFFFTQTVSHWHLNRP